ncbi:MAG: cytidylate kinase-like family protein [Bacteroidales bacterium]|nr:cytidylate kinase-like family protein [Bacteroidales bacterium]
MDTNKNFVITISREVGSGGRTIGRKLAEKLGVRYCDKDLINKLVDCFGLSVGSIERIKGEKKNWLADALQRFSPDPHAAAAGLPKRELRPGVTSDDVFAVESALLRKLADEGSCVIAGRSGFFVLKDHPNKIDIFIHASKPRRIERVMERQGKTREEAVEIISNVDEMRENFVQRFAGVSRYDARNYDLVLNVDGLDTDAAVELILRFIEKSRG